jgi:hypothetical protein
VSAFRRFGTRVRAEPAWLRQTVFARLGTDWAPRKLRGVRFWAVVDDEEAVELFAREEDAQAFLADVYADEPELG